MVEGGETGMVPEDSIEPLDMEALSAVEVSEQAGSQALGETVVIKLNGGLGKSNGLDRAKSLLPVRPGEGGAAGINFLDVIARHALSLRRRYGARLPLLFMNSFRTRDETVLALAAYD